MAPYGRPSDEFRRSSRGLNTLRLDIEHACTMLASCGFYWWRLCTGRMSIHVRAIGQTPAECPNTSGAMHETLGAPSPHGAASAESIAPRMRDQRGGLNLSGRRGDARLGLAKRLTKCDLNPYSEEQVGQKRACAGARPRNMY